MCKNGATDFKVLTLSSLSGELIVNIESLEYSVLKLRDSLTLKVYEALLLAFMSHGHMTNEARLLKWSYRAGP